MRDFVHLHVHSHYSFLDSMIRVGPLVARVKELGMSAVALTDHDVMLGALELHKAAKKAGVKPIFGCEMSVVSRDATDPADRVRYQVVLLARNLDGYRNLCRINHLAWSRGRVDGHPRVDPSVLEAHAEGLLLLTGNLAGDVPHHLFRGDRAEAERRLKAYQGIYGAEHVFVELCDHGIVEERALNTELVALARDCGAPIVATNDVHYLLEDDRDAHRVLMAIQLGRTVEPEAPLELPPGGYHLATGAEMAERFSEYPEALANTARVAELCDVEIPTGTYYLPQYECPPDKSLAEVLREMAYAGLDRRAEEASGRGEALDRAAYAARLDFELGVIETMGFPGYFLIVADYVQWARDAGVPVGPGRGSGAGSLVAF